MRGAGERAESPRQAIAKTKQRTGEFFHDVGESVVLERERPEFTRHVGALLGALPPTLGPFVSWAPHVARFSFAAAKSLD